MTKIKDAIKKRFKITKKGKILRRISGVCHNLSKKQNVVLRRKKKFKNERDYILNYLFYK